MKLILDCGGTSTKAAILKKSTSPTLFTTSGINLNLESEENLTRKIQSWALPENTEFNEIRAYLAGYSKKNTLKLKNALKNAKIHTKKLFLESDLLAAARAGLNKKNGIIAILGTGSNSGFYKDQEIKENIPPLGYLLGDEASGYAIGKKILNIYFRHQMNENLSLSLDEYLSNTLKTRQVPDFYTQNYPQKKIAQVCTWAIRHINDKQISEILIEEFELFFKNILSNYKKQSNQIAFIGSIAFYFQYFIKPIAAFHHFEIVSIQKNAIDGLIKFHSLSE